ncbi:Immune-associated nucleotide-binding protein 10 [Bulinus truncatus]|nr:Immune-associated nucleotide-binding protein 10 [Bulinus truncatus]
MLINVFFPYIKFIIRTNETFPFLFISTQISAKKKILIILGLSLDLAKMSNDKYIDLLIIGKTGNGKSATGNSILMRNAFKCIGSASSVTQTAKREYSKYKGRKIRVVDSPGFGETRLEGDESKKMVMKALKKAIMMSSDGYHAFLIALKFGNRFTKEEEDTIQFLKDVFGPNVVRDHCIIVMPCGDYFTAEHEGTGVTFVIWCNHQCGSMYSLIEECQGRIVLFDNKTKDAKVKEQQLDKLLDYVDRLGGRRYTDQNFEEAKEVRKRILVEAKKPIISEKIREKTSLIIQKIEQIQNSTNESKNQEKLQKLSKKCDKLIKAILFEDKGTGIIHDLLDSVKGLKSTTENEIKFNEKLMKEREESMKKEEAMKQAEAEEKQRSMSLNKNFRRRSLKMN